MTAQFTTLLAVTAASDITTVACGSNAKGSWAVASASLPHAVKWITLVMRPSGGNTSAAYLVDVGTGESGSEVVLIPDIYLDYNGSVRAMLSVSFPVDIASGTRLVVRGEGTSGGSSETIDIEVIVSDEAPPTLSTIDDYASYGTTPGSSEKGTVIDPGAFANTKATTYTELVDPFDADGEWVYVFVGRLRNTAMANANWLIDIALGASLSEVVKIANIYTVSRSTQDTVGMICVGPFPADLFQGGRVSARAQCDITDATDRLIGVALLSVNGTPAAGVLSARANYQLGI